MTTDELQEEVQYRIEERLGILCGADDPTPEQLKIANDDPTNGPEKITPNFTN